MREIFEKWMRVKEGKKTNTAYQYAASIAKISNHYSQNTGKKVDIYRENDLSVIQKISECYSVGGRYSEFGNMGNGTIRNAIATYFRFLKSSQVGKVDLVSELNTMDDLNNIPDVDDGNSVVDDEITSYNYNFTYERDLKNSLIAQAEQIFTDYKIYGENNDGVEFLVEGKRIDLLLEHKTDKTLLAVELKSGEADFRVFGQISMYIGLLSKIFPDRVAKGLIIAGEINDSLKNACLITDKISLKTYKMQLTLIDVV